MVVLKLCSHYSFVVFSSIPHNQSRPIIHPRDRVFEGKGNREQLFARWSQLPPPKRLEYIAPLIVRAIRTAEDKKLHLSLPEPVDFGSAESLRFTSPELLMDEKARPSFSSDVYAFGCVCTEVLSLMTLLS